MTTFDYRLEFLSDWRVGSGAGRSGSVDSVVLRDNDGFPYVPAKTITGILRDAAEHLAWSLDSGQPGPWTEFAIALFGSQPSMNKDLTRGPQPALLSVRPAHHSIAFKEAARLRGPGSETIVRSSTAIDGATGVARDHTLRTMEMARATSVLHGTASLECPPEAEGVALTFLAAAAAMIEEIGGGRRRGRGRCRVGLVGVDPDLDLLLGTPPTLSSTGPASDRDHVASQNDSSMEEPTESWYRIDITLDSELPVIIPAGTDGNVLSSHDHPLGTTLLPMVVALGERAGLPCSAMLKAGRLKVSDAAPTTGGSVFLRAPLAWSREKSPADAEHPTAFNTLRGVPKVVAKQVRSGWVTPGSGVDTALMLDVEMTTRAHASIADNVQRPTEAVGGLFTYTAIAAGQSFTFTVTARCGERLAGAIAGALSGNAAIGTSRKDDYGLVNLAPNSVVAIDQASSPITAGSEITLWCLSDTVILDHFGRHDPSAEGLTRAVEDACGLATGTLEVVVDKVRLRTERRDGWHSRWSLPRATMTAVAAGSVVVVRTTTNFDGVSRSALGGLGVGQRTAEGFGRIAVDHPLTTGTQFRVSTAARMTIDRPTQIRPINADEDRLLDVIEADHLAGRLKTASTVATRRLADAWGLDHLSRSQVSRIRGLLTTGAATDDRAALDALRAWLGDPQRSRRIGDKTRAALLAVLDDPTLLTAELLRNDRLVVSARTTREAIVFVLEASTRTRNRGDRRTEAQHV